jgi:hypothetical protein
MYVLLPLLPPLVLLAVMGMAWREVADTALNWLNAHTHQACGRRQRVRQ